MKSCVPNVKFLELSFLRWCTSCTDRMAVRDAVLYR